MYNDTNSTSDVYLYDRLSGQTRRVIEKAGQPAVSNSGQVVAGGVESPDGSCNIFNTCILLYDLQSNLLRKIALAARAGVELPSDISADGRFVTFETESPDVVPDDTNGKIDVFRFDTLNNTVESITAPSGIVVACCGGVRRTAISADGQHITFVSQDMPTVDIDTNGFLDVLIWDSVSNGFSISGKVLDNQNKPVVEAEISDGKGNKTITDIYGKFVFSNLKQGSYIFTPSKTGYVFYPSYQQVELSSNLENLDFIGALKSDTSIDYFALGDSVSAGHGLTDNAVDDPYYNCRRSDLSYPYIVKHELDKRYKSVTMYHFACSGAFAIKPKSLKTSDDLKDPLQWFGTQVALANNVLSAKSRPKDRKAIVTLTMGMNDYPWTNGFQMFYLLRGRTKEQFIADVNKIVDSSTDETEKQLRILLKNKNVTVIVVQYHSAFNMRSHIFKLTFGANDGCGLISSLECYDLVSYAVERLNQKLNEKLVGNLSRQFPNRVVFADGIYDQFKGGYDSYLEVPVDSHAAPQNTCGDALPTSADTWIQYPDDPNSFSFPKREATPFERIYPWPALEALSKVDNWRGDCFHPNRKGMEVIAAQVYRKLLVVTP